VWRVNHTECCAIQSRLSPKAALSIALIQLSRPSANAFRALATSKKVLTLTLCALVFLSVCIRCPSHSLVNTHIARVEVQLTVGHPTCRSTVRPGAPRYVHLQASCVLGKAKAHHGEDDYERTYNEVENGCDSRPDSLTVFPAARAAVRRVLNNRTKGEHTRTQEEQRWPKPPSRPIVVVNALLTIPVHGGAGTGCLGKLPRAKGPLALTTRGPL
jgi:hypothetical protein